MAVYLVRRQVSAASVRNSVTAKVVVATDATEAKAYAAVGEEPSAAVWTNGTATLVDGSGTEGVIASLSDAG